MAPIVVDPPALAGAGSAVSAAGDQLVTAVGTLGSVLAGCGAMAGHDFAGLAFGRSYEQAAQGVLNAVDSGVNACRNLGFGIEMVATNYSRAEAASTIGGGDALPAPAQTPRFDAPRVASPTGSGVAAPALWTMVEMFVGELWPDGDPAALRAAAAAWRTLGTAISGAAAQLIEPSGTVAGQQIDEAARMASALSDAGAGISKIASQCGNVATQLDQFADDVEAAQDAIRDLLNRLGTPQGLLGEVVSVFKGDAMKELKKIAEDIKAVMANLKRQVDGFMQGLQEGLEALDGAVVGLETYMRKEFTQYLGEDVGSKVATVFDTDLNIGEGFIKGAAGLVKTAEQLDPLRFAYDPDGAASTWKGLWDLSLAANPIFAPLHPEETLHADKEVLKGLVHAEDWSKARPGLGAGEVLFDVSTLLIPGAGEAGATAKGAEAAAGAARGLEAEADAAGTVGRAGARAGEATRGAAGALNPIGEQSGKLAADLDKIGDNIPTGAQAAAPGQGIPPSALDHAPPETAAPRGLPDGRAPEAPPAEHAPAPAASGAGAGPSAGTHEPAPVGEHPTSTAPGAGVHEPAPVAPGQHTAPAPAGDHPPSTAPHVSEPAPVQTPVSPDGSAAAPAPAAAHAPQSAQLTHGSVSEAPATTGLPSELRPTADPGVPGGGHGPGVGDGGGRSGLGGSEGGDHGGSGSGGGDHGASGDEHHTSSDGSSHHDSHTPGDGSPTDHEGPHADETSSTGLTDEKRDEILATEKGARPDPAEYLSPEYIEQHLEKFDDGATRFMPENNFEKYGIAQRDGTSFVMAKNEVDAMLESTHGDPRGMERALGWPEGYLEKHKVIRIDIPHPQGHNMRVPSGNEAGANDLWLPGGLLPDGLSEAIIDGGTLASDDYIITDLME